MPATSALALSPDLRTEENVSPMESDAPPPGPVSGSRPGGGVRLLAVGACAVVLLLFAGGERTLNRRTQEPAAESVPPLAAAGGAQPVAPPAPPSGQEQPAVVDAVTVEVPVPPRRLDPNAESNGRSTPVAVRIEPHEVPSPQQHAAEPAVVSMSEENAPPQTRPQTLPRSAEVKEPSPSPPTATPREVLVVVTTPHGIPQSKARQVELSPVVAPPVSSSAQKKKVIPWP